MKWNRQELESSIDRSIDEHGWDKEYAKFEASLQTTCINTSDWFNCDNCDIQCRHNTKPSLGNGTKSKYFIKYIPSSEESKDA